MRCDECRHYQRKKHYGSPTAPRYGLCKHLTSGNTDKVEIYSNTRDGEWVETVVEVEPDFFCAEHKQREE